MLLLQATAQSLNLCARVIRDAYAISIVCGALMMSNNSLSGRTQIASGSQTVLGIGPGKLDDKHAMLQ